MSDTTNTTANGTSEQGMRVRFNRLYKYCGDRVPEGTVGRVSPSPKDGEWNVFSTDDKWLASFVGDTLPSYLDPLPAEPVEEEGEAIIKVPKCLNYPCQAGCGKAFISAPVDDPEASRWICTDCKATMIDAKPLAQPTKPIPEPAGEIVLPEADQNNVTRFDDGTFVRPHKDIKDEWVAVNKYSVPMYPPQNTPLDRIPKGFASRMEAARALAAISQGPGAVVEEVLDTADEPDESPRTIVTCDGCLKPVTTFTATDSSYFQVFECPDCHSKPAAQPAPPPFDVERLAAGIIEGVCHYILEMFPGIREDAHGKAVENAVDAMKAALGGEE